MQHVIDARNSQLANSNSSKHEKKNETVQDSRGSQKRQFETSENPEVNNLVACPTNKQLNGEKKYETDKMCTRSQRPSFNQYTLA